MSGLAWVGVERREDDESPETIDERFSG